MNNTNEMSAIPDLSSYLDFLSLTEKLARLLEDVIRDEFARLGIIEINAAQGLLLFNIGDNEVTAGELKSRGYYLGSNVSYNLQKLVENSYMNHQRSESDHRSVLVRLTTKGQGIRQIVAKLFAGHGDDLISHDVMSQESLDETIETLRRVETYLTGQIRNIY